MNIAIIGTGNIGGTLAAKWALTGHRIFFGVRDVENFKGKDLLGETITVHTIAEAVKNADVILIAAVPPATRDIVNAMGGVGNKIIIDAMNSVRTKAENFDSTAEALRQWTGSPNIVKCFNSAGFNVMADTDFGGTKADMYMAGNSAEAKAVAKQLAVDAGFEECYDFGGDDRIPLLESFAMVWINLAMMQGLGREIAFKLMRR
jgi:predicted dinucleotide-binding enzyme